MKNIIKLVEVTTGLLFAFGFLLAVAIVGTLLFK
jgi:hypothetical protein